MDKGQSIGAGNSFANGAFESGSTIPWQVRWLGWEYLTLGKTMSTTIYDLGA
ncbi:MAG TPA: hypothetical protein VGG75_13820 [Trebonia sp.]|jgi:hypothetical protein